MFWLYLDSLKFPGVSSFYTQYWPALGILILKTMFSRLPNFGQHYILHVKVITLFIAVFLLSRTAVGVTFLERHCRWRIQVGICGSHAAGHVSPQSTATSLATHHCHSTYYSKMTFKINVWEDICNLFASVNVSVWQSESVDAYWSCL